MSSTKIPCTRGNETALSFAVHDGQLDGSTKETGMSGMEGPFSNKRAGSVFGQRERFSYDVPETRQ
jgi:hypothetical protein